MLIIIHLLTLLVIIILSLMKQELLSPFTDKDTKAQK